MKVISLSGSRDVARSAAAYLHDMYDYRIMSFTSPCKQIAQILGFDPRDIYQTELNSSENMSFGIGANEFLPLFADAMRSMMPGLVDCGEYGDIWVKVLRVQLENLQKEEKKYKTAINVVIDDVNDPLALRFLRNMKATMVTCGIGCAVVPDGFFDVVVDEDMEIYMDRAIQEFNVCDAVKFLSTVAEGSSASLQDGIQ